jgi:hypothetical protein
LLTRILQKLLGLDIALIAINRKLDAIVATQEVLKDDVAKIRRAEVLQTETLVSMDARLGNIEEDIDEIRESVTVPPASRLALHAISISGDYIESGENYMPKLHPGDSYTLQVEPKNAAGNPAAIDGLPAWSPEPADAPVSLEVSENGMSCKVTATAATGDALIPYAIKAEADADLGEGVRKIMAAGSGFVIPPGIEATVLDLVEGPVTPGSAPVE